MSCEIFYNFNNFFTLTLDFYAKNNINCEKNPLDVT